MAFYQQITEFLLSGIGMIFFTGNTKNLLFSFSGNIILIILYSLSTYFLLFDKIEDEDIFQKNRRIQLIEPLWKILIISSFFCFVIGLLKFSSLVTPNHLFPLSLLFFLEEKYILVGITFFIYFFQKITPLFPLKKLSLLFLFPLLLWLTEKVRLKLTNKIPNNYWNIFLSFILLYNLNRVVNIGLLEISKEIMNYIGNIYIQVGTTILLLIMSSTYCYSSFKKLNYSLFTLFYLLISKFFFGINIISLWGFLIIRMIFIKFIKHNNKGCSREYVLPSNNRIQFTVNGLNLVYIAMWFISIITIIKAKQLFYSNFILLIKNTFNIGIIALSVLITFFVLMQRGEEGAFASVANQQKMMNDNMILVKITAFLIVLFILSCFIASVVFYHYRS